MGSGRARQKCKLTAGTNFIKPSISLVLELMELSPQNLIKHEYAKGFSCCSRSYYDFVVYNAKVVEALLPLCHSDFVSYNVKVVKALLPYPPLPSLHIYLQSEGLSEWHTSRTRVINMTLRNKIRPLSPPYFLIRQPSYPSIRHALHISHMDSLPSFPSSSSVSLLNAAMAHIQIHHSAQSAAVVDPSVRPSDYHNKGARV